MPDTIEVDVRMEKLRKLRFQMCPDEIEWKEVDHLLAEKSAAAASIVRDFTVHHQRSPLVVSRPKDLDSGKESCETVVASEDPHWETKQDTEGPLSPGFELQQLDDSPRSSQLHIKDVQDMGPDGQECQSQFFELGVMKETPPDILDSTKQAFITINTSSQQLISNPCLTTFCGKGEVIGEQCLITTRKPASSDQSALMNEGLRTSSYSTFRPPNNTFQAPFLEVRNRDNDTKPETPFLQSSDHIDVQKPQSRTSSPSLRSKVCEKPPPVLKDPDIGDEPIIVPEQALKKKELIGLQVATPVVPTLEKESSGSSADAQSKKGWSITTV